MAVGVHPLDRYLRRWVWLCLAAPTLMALMLGAVTLSCRSGDSRNHATPSALCGTTRTMEGDAHLLPLVVVLALGTVVTFAGAAWVAQYVSLQLRRAIESLAEPLRADSAISVSTSPPNGLRITEIEATRQEIQRARSVQFSAAEDERRLIARHIHDCVQQNLGALRINVDLLTAPGTSSQGLTEVASTSQDLIDGAVQELDIIVDRLRPQALDMLGLLEALEILVERFHRRAQLQIELEFWGDEQLVHRLTDSVANCMYRVAEEFINDVNLHAQASFVHLVLDATEPAFLRLLISGDGNGIALDTLLKPNSSGLRRLAEQVSALGGDMRISCGHDANPSHGTTLIAKIPLGET